MQINKKKVVKTTGIILGSIIGLAVIATLVINFLFRDQLIQIVIGQLNKQVNAKITISKVDFSLWKQFPNVSVWLDKAYVQSSNEFKDSNNIAGSDTLLLADKVFFEFNLFQLLRSKYNLKRVSIENGYIKLKADRKGLLNYDIIKSSADKKETNDFSLELNNLRILNSKVEYENLESNVRIIGYAEKLGINGDLHSKFINLTFHSNLMLKELTVKDYRYAVNKYVQLNFNLKVNDKHYTISDAVCTINKLNLSTNGEFTTGDRGQIKFILVSNNAGFDELVTALPQKVVDYFNGYNTKGKANIRVTISGKTNAPSVNITFGVRNASVVHIASGVKVKDLFLSGSYNYEKDADSQKSLLKVDKASLSIGSGKASGDFQIIGVDHPLVKVNTSYALDLKDLKHFLNLDTLEEFSGKVDGNLVASGNVSKSSNVRFPNIDNMVCTGQVQLHDAGFKLKNSDYYFEKINGNITIDENLSFNNISLFVLENDFLINGSLLQWSNYLLKHQKDVTLKANVMSKSLDLSKYFTTDKRKTDAVHSSELLFPDNINLEVKVNVNKFKLNKFNAKWVSGYINYKPKMFVLKSLTFETMDGRVTGNGAIIQDVTKNFIVKGQVDISKLDIKQLFYTFNNFSQNILQDRHLQGRVSGKVGISAMWNNSLALDKDKLIVDADVTIEKGELVNFEPMMKLSRFIAIDELRNIRFSTLKNRITIKDKQITIPQMNVYSSAFDISASGQHLFDNHYTYRLKILFSDILWGKARRAKRENEEFGVVEDDGLGKTTIPISITGYNSDYKITYDSKKALDVMKESFKTQKREMKEVLHDEFGWFKKDTTLSKKKAEKKSNGIRVEWEEANQDDSKSAPNPVNKKNSQPKPQVEWDN